MGCIQISSIDLNTMKFMNIKNSFEISALKHLWQN